MNKLNAILIDDDRNFCQTFHSLAENSFNFKIAHSGKEGLELLKSYPPHVVLLDLKLGSSMNGLEVLKRIKKTHPDLPVIMITDFADVSTAVEAMKLGALHYTSKSPNINALKLIIERQLEQVNWKLLYQQSTSNKYDLFVAESPVMKSILQDIQQVARTDSTILIEGESGTGKEITAREIHRRSKRSDNPFLAINCSTLTPLLFESEFFGHEKGAFTSADTRKIGQLELAHCGTILLDEIADLPPESQAKILRAIEDKSFQRLGGTETIKVNVRFIVASNKNLKPLVEEKLFRKDLFFRLSVITIKIPPLRQRREDIPPLIDLFLTKFANEMNKQKPGLSSAALKKLQNYPWQGNIRELRNFIERLMVFHSGEEIIEDIEISLGTKEETLQIPPQLINQPYDKAKQSLINDFKRIYFESALQRNKGNITATAKEIGVNRSSLYKILKELGD